MGYSVASILVALSIASTGHAYVLAERVQQGAQIVKKADYLGGWAWATTGTCPANFPVTCKDVENNSCCPTGNTCFASGAPYCCPTASDCKTTVVTLPVCADATMNMYKLFSGYFCCDQDHIGVTPSAGWGGLCLAKDQAVPVSLLATMYSQVGGTSVTPFGGYGTTTASAGSAKTASPASASARVTVTTTTASDGKISTATVTLQSSSSTDTNGSGSSKGINLGTGAIVGIAVGGAVIIAVLIYSFWKCCSRRNSQQAYYNPPSAPLYVNQGLGRGTAPPYDPIMERGPNRITSPVSSMGSPMMQAYKPVPIVASHQELPPGQYTPQPRTPQPQQASMHSHEVDGSYDGIHGRVEM